MQQPLLPISSCVCLRHLLPPRHYEMQLLSQTSSSLPSEFSAHTDKEWRAWCIRGRARGVCVWGELQEPHDTISGGEGSEQPQTTNLRHLAKVRRLGVVLHAIVAHQFEVIFHCCGGVILSTSGARRDATRAVNDRGSDARVARRRRYSVRRDLNSRPRECDRRAATGHQPFCLGFSSSSWTNPSDA